MTKSRLFVALLPSFVKHGYLYNFNNQREVEIREIYLTLFNIYCIEQY